ncbi:MAG: glycogen/starch/alpha-glucan family phosphorylase [Clostridia bacterium]|nr:glycogen/starch/alpha-glucan family phosphorylase [Clostridia bacterium]
MQQYTIDRSTLKTHYEEAAQFLFNKQLNKLSSNELNRTIAYVIKSKVISPNLEKANNLYSEKRIAVYFSIEFLIGRVIFDALNNTQLLKLTTEILNEEGIDINSLEDVPDTALGNGGLGRLAACFIESAATLGYPLYGAGLFYKFGLFKQIFDNNGNQIEVPDVWNAEAEAWFEPNSEDEIIVEFRDTKVKAVPYILPIIGYNSNPEAFTGNAFPLTLWKAEAIPGVTNDSATKISDYLYPDDSTDEGKKLRIRQEYFFTSATLQKIFKTHLEKHGTLDNIEDYYIFQMNDTHPVMASLEFIRLLKLNGYSFKEASEKAKKCFAYTNHTIMSEALEKWDINLFKALLPDIFQIIQDLNQELIDYLIEKKDLILPNKDADLWKIIYNYQLFTDGVIHMSRIACYIGCSINGVAAVHSEIIKQDTLKQWAKVFPDKFNNKTNGVTPRRWLKLANPELAEFLTKHLGNENWITNLPNLEELEKFKNDSEVLADFANIKIHAKQRLADYIQKTEGITIDPNSIFDCQVKRIHEYKRQLMNALRILYIYAELKKGNLPDFYPTTFIIGGKAAASYRQAKLIIKLIKDIQNLVNNDSEVNDKIKVIFLTNFNVSYSEKVYAGANFSEQISTAGTEASGTGNMKFMLNGSPTIGTSDGANIEIVEEAGTKNNYEFGADVSEFKRIKYSYNHEKILSGHPEFNEILDYLRGRKNLKFDYWDLVNTLLLNDRYYVMYDLESYIDITLKANHDYAKEQTTGDFTYYTRKGFKNTIHSGKFSSDRTIDDYAKEIWHIEKIHVE